MALSRIGQGTNRGALSFMCKKKSDSSIVGEIEEKHGTNIQVAVIRRQGSDSEARRLMLSATGSLADVMCDKSLARKVARR